MTGVVIAGGARTAIGSYGKSLKNVPPTELGTAAATAAIERSGIDPGEIEQVFFGHVLNTEPADVYMARVVGVRSGVPKESAALTVNRLCGSGAQAIVSGAQAIRLGDARTVLAGGAESMSRVPYWAPDVRWGARLGDARLVDAVSGALTDPFHDYLMGVTAENLAEQMGISRERQDAFAAESHRRAQAAWDDGIFEDEVVAVKTGSRNGAMFSRDEHIRENVTVEELASLRPVFKEGGTVTAGNASGMNDGGAAVVLMSDERARELEVQIKARIVAYAVCGVDPAIMGIGPVPAIRNALARAELTLEEIGVIELNEAFAAQALAVIEDLGLDPDRVNPNGGAVALGHPIGATGAAITVKCISEMHRGGHDFGVVSLCIGGGQGIALVLGRGDV